MMSPVSTLGTFFGRGSRPGTSSSTSSSGSEAFSSPAGAERPAFNRHLSLPPFPSSAHTQPDTQRTRLASVPNLPPYTPERRERAGSTTSTSRCSVYLHMPTPLRHHLHLPFPFATPPSPLATLNTVSSRIPQPELIPPSPSQRVSVIVEQLFDLSGHPKPSSVHGYGHGYRTHEQSLSPPCYVGNEKEGSPPPYEPNPPRTLMRYLFFLGFSE